MPKAKNPARVKLSDEKRTRFTQFICDQLNQALSARGEYIRDGGYLDTWHALYEQTALPEAERPFEGAADLPTYLVTEKVDALASRLVSIMFNADPICVAESWGNADAARTARVEAFHQWQAEQEKLKGWVAKAIKMSLIEQTGVLAVDERPVLAKVKRETEVLIQTTEHGEPLMDVDGAFVPKTHDDGSFAEYDGAEPDAPRMKAILTETKPVGFGPQYRVVGLKNFLFLPAHAEDQQDLFGFAERIWSRTSDIQQLIDAGIYDKDFLDRIGADAPDRTSNGTDQRHRITAETDNGPYAEKELWKLHICYDIDDDGVPEWLLVTVSLSHTEMGRCDFDTLNQVRYVPLTPFPDPENVYGFSFVGHKLWTIADEHTALRNMIANRSALAIQAPLKRLTTSAWDPDDQPWGIGAILDVRDMNDLQPVQVPDVPNSAEFLLNHAEQAAERLSGMNDAAVSGVLNGQDRTATEVTTAAQASYVRVSEAMNYLRDALSTIYDLRHALWVRALEAREGGIVAPSRIMRDFESRGLEVPTDGPLKFTKDDLAGQWRFKPRGSVETADEGAMRQDFNVFLANVLPQLVQAFPALAQFRNSPEAARSFVSRALQLYKITDANVLLKAMFEPPPQPQAPQMGVGAPVAPGGPSATPPNLPPDLVSMLGGGPAGAPMIPGQPTIA